MRNALRGVHQHQRTRRMSLLHDLRHGIDRSQHIRDRRDRHQARPFVEQIVERIEDQESVVGNRYEPNLTPRAFCQLLPGHDVRMVFHFRQNDFVLGPHEAIAPTAGNQVDRGGGTGREDHFVPMRRLNESTNRLPRFFVQIGALLAEPVNPAMHVGVVPFVGFHQGIDHLAGTLSRGRVVKVHQRLVPMEHRRQDREIRTVHQRIEGQNFH